MKICLFLLSFAVPSLLIAYPALAVDTEESQQPIHKLLQKNLEIPSLSEIELPATEAQLLTQQSESEESEKPAETEPPINEDSTNEGDIEEDSRNEGDIEIEVTGEKDSLPLSTPTYVIEKEEIEKQGSTSVADVLKRMPGFAINDVGPGADIHTGTYYRGASINQSIFLINGRPINTNINTYHGATDLNSIPTEAIERVELYSGAASILYGSSTFGGVVNIITKEGSSIPKLNATAEFGSLSLNNQQASYAGSLGSVRYNFSFERFFTDNRYRVPEGAANRDAEGYLFNADTATSTYFGNLIFDLNDKNTLSLDVTKLSSRRGLVYFGFPLQKDRLDHDGLNLGLSWKTLLGNGENSVLTTTLGYNQDYFSTYGPTVFRGVEYYRTGVLDTQQLTARIDHEWQLTPNNKLRWGLDLKNTDLNSETDSTRPDRIALNEIEDRNVFNTGLFAVNTWNITNALQLDFGLRQSFDSQFGNYLNPSAGLRYAVTPSLAVRGSWTGGQRNPGLDQLYVYDTVHGWLPNPDLEPETGSSWTAGVDVNFSENLIGQFTYFGSSLDNRLGIINGRWENIGLVDTNGFEAALRWKIASRWSTFVNYTYTDAQIKTGIEKGLQLGMIPYSVAQAGISYASGGWQANLYTTYNSGARRAFFTNPGDKTTDFVPSFFNLDFSARVPITQTLGITVYLENLLDEQYERVNRTYSPGFTFRIGLTSNL
ncbi:TonB-dependent receptor plug domain-containing protein [Chlorogloeopsis fritschii PCC 9212]|uniref:TonB-dependent receptor plug domain-containing protein n=1 Tax=Chlorogloeopsis fritschii TaxID=1124 RepID=UPI00031892DC|nr:TonB-dependent receptor [Chlorogloeopsis fritschii]